MARTDSLPEQHADIQSISCEFNASLDRALDAAEAQLASSLLSKMHALVGYHLATEDLRQYRDLLNHVSSGFLSGAVGANLKKLTLGRRPYCHAASLTGLAREPRTAFPQQMFLITPLFHYYHG